MVSTPAYGQRLLPNIIDERSKADPDHVVYSFPRTNNVADGFRDVTNRQFADAVNKVAWLLHDSLGKGERQESIGYIGPADITYLILFAAAPKAGYAMLFNSPRNSLAGHLNVINKANCNVWALSSSKPQVVDDILRKQNMRTVLIPDLDEILSNPPSSAFAHDKIYEQAKDEPLVTLHTSGSTGLPKPITWTNETAAIYDVHNLLPQEEGKDLHVIDWAKDGRKIYSAFPFFHAAGSILHFCAAMFFNLSFVFGPASAPLSVNVVRQILDARDDLQGVFLPPSIAEELSKSPEMLQKLRGVRFLAYAGGPLAYDAGHRISQYCRVDNILGSTEAMQYPSLVQEPEDWHYFHFHPQASFVYEPYSECLFEMFSVREEEKPQFTSLHVTFPKDRRVSTSDLYAPHPSKPGRYLYQGRADDIIVLSNGEKVNPIDMEATIDSHAAVKGAIIAGQARFQTAALVELYEPTTDQEKLKSLNDSLRPVIQKANAQAPAHGRIQPGFVLFTNPDKPFARAPKGTIIRSRTVKAYEEELDQLFSSTQDAPSTSALKIDLESRESILSQVAAYIESLVGHSVGPQDDLFAAGLDSLLILQLARTLDATLSAAGRKHNLSASVIYAHPTTEQLTTAIHNVAHGETIADDSEANSKAIQGLVDKYTKHLSEEAKSPKQLEPGQVKGVVLTGSTGSLGAYLLDRLLKERTVRYIYCLNRSADGRSRQLQASGSRGLSCEWPEERVKFFHADFSREKFALQDGEYEELLQNTTHIIHNQWPVNFNISLSSFEPHIFGVRNLVNFSLASSHSAHITFISSIATGQNSPADKVPVPEEPIQNFNYASMGYGSSKLTSEAILDVASKKAGVPSTVIRVGQIAGPVENDAGMWNKAEWLPTIISTSEYMGKLPSSLGGTNICDWVPVDKVAPIVLEMAGISASPTTNGYHEETSHSSSPTTTKFYHIQNPHHTPWSSLLPTIQSHLTSSTTEGRRKVDIVPLSEWVESLRASSLHPDPSHAQQNPGIPLLDFYENLVESDERNESKGQGQGQGQVFYALEKSREVSRTLRETEAVNEWWVERWMGQWGWRVE